MVVDGSTGLLAVSVHGWDSPEAAGGWNLGFSPLGWGIEQETKSWGREKLANKKASLQPIEPIH